MHLQTKLANKLHNKRKQQLISISDTHLNTKYTLPSNYRSLGT